MSIRCVLPAVVVCFALAFTSSATAAITEFALPTANAQPTGITSGPDGNLWVAESESSVTSRIARVTPAGEVTEFIYPANREPLDVAAAGGLIWFTERLGDRIGRINPLAGNDAAIQASVTEFIVPGVGSRPTGIAAGADGNLWFTQAGSGEIGRVTPAGLITEVAVPGLGSEPTGIAAGPDGALWFTQVGSSQVGRITTAGVVTNEFAVPALNSQPTQLGAITEGPDGALWFVDSANDRVWRITTAGELTGFPAPVGSGPGGIASGPDGALWLTEGRQGKIARMATDGTVSQYTLPSAGGSADITVGPDGALWFTEKFDGRVGRITTDTVPDAPPADPTPPEPSVVTVEKLVVVAFKARPARPRAGRRVSVSFAITAAAEVSLTVQRLGAGARPPRTVASGNVAGAGVTKLIWNGKFGRKEAPEGRYRLTVAASANGVTTESRLRVQLR